MKHLAPALALSLALPPLVACKSEPPKNLAPPAASPLESAKPATASAQKFQVVTSSSAVTWVMDAPLEKIYGTVPNGASGDLFVDLTDVTKTTGLVQVNLKTFELSQQKREDEKGEFGAKETIPTQTEHARAWLEISPDAPADVRAKNEVIEFKINSVTTTGEKDITKLTGDSRAVNVQVVGDFVLHGRQVSKSAELEVTFAFTGDQATGLRIRTTKPVVVGLEEHDVRPRDAFGKLAKRTLAAVGNKVAAQAPIDLDLHARTASVSR